MIPPEEEKAKEDSYVSSFICEMQVTSFTIGNGKLGLQVSSFVEHPVLRFHIISFPLHSETHGCSLSYVWHIRN